MGASQKEFDRKFNILSFFAHNPAKTHRKRPGTKKLCNLGIFDPFLTKKMHFEKFQISNF